jgi:hypothetical protein
MTGWGFLSMLKIFSLRYNFLQEVNILTKPIVGGAPSKYKPEYCKMIDDFFSRPLQDEIVKHVEDIKFVKGKPTKVKRKITETVTGRIPFIEEFSRSINISHKQLLVWAQTYPEFGEALARAKEKQREYLSHQTLLGRYNPQFAIFLAKNITDMRDIQGHEVSGVGGGPIATTGDITHSIDDKSLAAIGAAIVKAKTSDSQ